MVISVLFIPVSIFLLPIFKPSLLWQSYIYILVMVIGFTAITRYVFKNKLDCFIIASALATIILLVDTFTGSYLVQNCPLGYDPQIGARYFGLGNEVMGILLGSAILFTTLLIDKFNKHASKFKIFSVVVYLIIIFTLTFPGLGTKAGGAITAFAAFAVVILKLFEKKVSWKQVIGISAGILALLLALIIVDVAHKGGATSHIGRAGMLIKEGGPIQAWYIIVRKVSMNLKLMRYSRWSSVLIASLILLAFLYKLNAKFLRDMFKNYKYAYIGLLGTIVSALVALVFNDSGIIACATNSIYPMMLLIYLEGREKDVR
jgi:hypothetical protein